RLVFSAPRPETLAVTWYAVPERATIYGWPLDLGPFAGLWVSWWGRDSLRGTLLFDQTLGGQVRPGVTAQFVAGRRRPQLSSDHERSPMALTAADRAALVERDAWGREPLQADPQTPPRGA